MQLAFDLYATGDWPVRRLTEHLEAQGLTSRPSAKRSAMPIGKGSIHKMLRNVYYVGIVEYRGRRVPGRHTPLIDRDTFDRVQALLTARALAGDRPSKHEHYLRGSLYCADCGARLLYSKNRGNGGLYEYFTCSNRYALARDRRCQARHYPAAAIEREIENYYRTIELTDRVREAIWEDMRQDAGERGALIARETERQQRRIKTLQDDQARLVELSFKGLVSDEVLADQQRRLEDQKQQAQKLLQTAQLQAEDIDTTLAQALATTKTPHATYRASSPLERRLLNQAFFKRILIGEDGEVLGATLTPVYDALAAWHPPLGKTKAETARKTPVDGPKGRKAANPGRLSGGQGLYLTPMVGSSGHTSNQPADPSDTVLSALLAVLADEEVRSRLGVVAQKLATIRQHGDARREPKRQRRRSRRPGWVQAAVVTILTQHGASMQVKDIHAGVEALVGEAVPKSSINAVLSADVRRSSATFVRVAKGHYRLAG